MPIPNLKRVKIGSTRQLNDWLARNAGLDQSVMLVTHTNHAPDKHVSAADLRSALKDHGWQSGVRYTLNAHLVGHVASPCSVG